MSNLIAVPLSTIILFAELFLVLFYKFSFLAKIISTFIFYAIQFLNETIVQINNIPFSIWDNIYADVWSTIFLYGFVVFGLCWILQHQKHFFKLSLCFSLLYFVNNCFAEIKTLEQDKLIIYNHSHQLAIDYLSKNKFLFLGDSSIEKDEKIISNVLESTRIYYRANEPLEINKQINFYKNIISIHNKRIMVLDSAYSFLPIKHKIDFDVLLVSKNPKLNFHEILCAIQPKIIVFDASNSLWKITKWKRECEALNLRCFSIKDQGAFVMNMQ